MPCGHISPVVTLQLQNCNMWTVCCVGQGNAIPKSYISICTYCIVRMFTQLLVMKGYHLK